MPHLVVPYAPGSVGDVRRQVVAELRARGVDAGVVDDAALVVSELLGNALRHGQPLAGDVMTADWDVVAGGLRVCVTDGGAGPAGPGSPQVLDECGRGLQLVDAVSRSWGVCHEPTTTSTVWAELPTPH